MKKVDRLGWTAGIGFTAYGVSVGIRVNDPAILDDLVPLLPPEWEPVDDPVVDILFSLRVGPPSQRKGRRNYHLLYSGVARLARSMEMDEIFERLESELHIMVALWAQEDHLFVHAGVVGWKGKAIVIPGRSHSGKTTLVSALMQAGATYYSDDMAIFDPQGLVHPYPVPLAMREEGGRCKYTPEALGSVAGQTPLPVGLVVVTRYEDGALWRPRQLSPGRALSALLDNTVAVRRIPRMTMLILQRVAMQASAIKTKRGEAADVVAPLLAAVDKEWLAVAG